MIGLIMRDILFTIGAVSKRFRINSLQFINNFNMETFLRGAQKENLIRFLLIRSLNRPYNSRHNATMGFVQP